MSAQDIGTFVSRLHIKIEDGLRELLCGHDYPASFQDNVKNIKEDLNLDGRGKWCAEIPENFIFMN